MLLIPVVTIVLSKLWWVPYSYNTSTTEARHFHNQLYQNYCKTLTNQYVLHQERGKNIIPEDKGSSHIILNPADSRFVHQHICPYLQDTQHHPTTLYSPCSQPLHSMTWNVQPCHKFLPTGHICSLWDNNVPCLNNRQPATAATVIVKKHFTLWMSSDSCLHLVRLVECLSLHDQVLLTVLSTSWAPESGHKHRQLQMIVTDRAVLKVLEHSADQVLFHVMHYVNPQLTLHLDIKTLSCI